MSVIPAVLKAEARSCSADWERGGGGMLLDTSVDNRNTGHEFLLVAVMKYPPEESRKVLFVLQF